MKRRLQIISTASAASIMAFAALAEPNLQRNGEASVTPRRQPAPIQEIERLGPTEKASDLLGREVKNYQNEKLGKVDNLAVDLESGRIVQVVLSIGGLLGVGDRLIAVPPGALHNDAPNKVVHLDADKEKLKAAPRFEPSQWEGAQSKQVASVYQYYGQEPYFDTRVEARVQTDDGAVSRGRSASAVLGYTQKASKIIGTPVKNLSEEKLGKVENLVVDLAAGRVVGVIVSSGGFLGIGDELSAVPPTAFQFNPTHDTLRLDATKEALAAAPHFKSSQWPDFSQTERTTEIYRAYHVEPYFSSTVTIERDPTARNVRERVNRTERNESNTTDADNSARNARDRDGATLTPLDQGQTPADRNTSAQIRKQIMGTKDLSTNARNIKIITINGRVTLRGPVNSEEERRFLGDIAAGLTANEKVDNQLEVKSNQP